MQFCPGVGCGCVDYKQRNKTMKPCAYITQSGGVHTLPTVLDEVTTFKPTSVSFEYLVLNLTSTQFFFSGGVACNYVMYVSCFSGFITIVMRIELEIENNPSVDTTASHRHSR